MILGARQTLTATLPFLISLLHTASAAHFYDPNSLRAFDAAQTPEQLALLFTSDPDLKANLSSDSSLSTIPTTAQDDAPVLDTFAKRAGSCGNYNACTALGASSLCCSPQQVCSADVLGHVGCCPLNAACTGTIPSTAGATGVVAASTTTTQTTTSLAGVVLSTTTTAASTPTGGFVIAGSSTVVVFGTSAAQAVKVVSLNGLLLA